ncbi:MAG: protein kinase, partial [Chloroflexota bacterium]
MPESLIGKTIENYRIDRLLGQGGMAAVYEVFDLKLKRRVAMKIMHEHLASQNAFRDMFVREGQNAARLDHPFIVKVYGFNITGEYLYIVMELIEGGNLRRYVKRLAEIGQFIDYAEAAEIVRQLSSAIHYAHDRGMVHRDLKPDNVMLKPRKDKGPGLNYRPIITDFGLARLTTAGDEQATATQPIGTYPYMSPEQVNAEPVDRRTDIYALGIILFELSVGRLPYNPKSIAEAARMHGREPVPKPSEFYRDFPKPLEDIIMKCLEKDVERRYQTAEEIVRDLTVFINQGPRAQSKLPNLVEERPQQSTSSVMAPPARRQDRQPQQPPAEQQPPAQPREQQAQQQPPVQSPPVQPQAPQPPAPQQGQRPPLQPRPRQGQQSVPERQQDEQSPAQPGQGQQQPSQAGQQPPAQQQGQQPPPQTYPQPVQLPADDEPQVDTDYGDGDESEQGRRRGLFGRLFGGRDDRDDDRNSRDEDETDRRDERQPSAPQQQVIQPVVVPPVPQQPQSAPPQQPPEDQYAPDESAIANIQQNIEPPQVNKPPAQQTADRYTTQEASILDNDDMPADTGQANDSRSAAPPMQVDDDSRPVARSPQQPSSGQPYDAGYAQPPVEEPYTIGEDAPTPPPDVDETTYGSAPAQQRPYDAGDSYTFNENAPTPPPDIDESTYGAPAQQPYDAGDSYTFNENAPTPPPDYGDEEPRYSVYSTQEASILDADTLSTPVPGSGPAYGSPEEYRQYRQAAIEQEEEYITEIETSVMPQQIATNLPMSVPSVERTAYQRDIDCLAIYSHDHSYIVELPTSQAEFQIGREPKDDIFLEGDLISRDHAVLERKPNGFYYLIDGDSTNGTYIGTDQLPANKPIILREGTTIRMGNYWMQLLPRMSGGAAPGIAQPYDDDYSTDAGFDPVAEGPPTQLMGFIPVADMPKVEPPRLTGEQLMTDRLVIYHKGRAPQIVLLKDAQYVIGRSEDNDIVLPDQNVSRRHAVIDRSDDFYYI